MVSEAEREREGGIEPSIDHCTRGGVGKGVEGRYLLRNKTALVMRWDAMSPI